MKVWFVLHKEGTNEQISRGAASVTVDDVADIDDLRKAIKVECVNKLQHVDPGALAVYHSRKDDSGDIILDDENGAINTRAKVSECCNNDIQNYTFIVTAPVRDTPSSPRNQGGGECFCIEYALMLYSLSVSNYVVALVAIFS